MSIAIAILTISALQADELSGKLIWEAGFIVFRTDSSETKYNFLKVPGMKTIDYRHKTDITKNQEIRIDEILLETNTGENILLTPNNPVPITRISEGSTVRWVVPER